MASENVFSFVDFFFFSTNGTENSVFCGNLQKKITSQAYRIVFLKRKKVLTFDLVKRKKNRCSFPFVKWMYLQCLGRGRRFNRVKCKSESMHGNMWKKRFIAQSQSARLFCVLHSFVKCWNYFLFSSCPCVWACLRVSVFFLYLQRIQSTKRIPNAGCCKMFRGNVSHSLVDFHFKMHASMAAAVASVEC